MKRTVLFADHHGDLLGGGQMSLLGLMQGLVRWEPVFACGDAGEMADLARRAGVPVHIVEMPALSLRSWRKVRKGVRKIRRLIDGAGAVLVHANSSRGMFYAGAAGRMSGVPVVWHVRVARNDGWRDRLLAGLASRIVVISRSVQARFERIAPEKVRLIHNGVDLAAFGRADGAGLRRELGIGARPVVGMVAQLIPWKRQRDFLLAAERIVETHPETLFLLVGEDPDPAKEYERSLRSLVEERGLEGKVVFMGFRRDVPRVMAMLDVLVLCSEEEPFGRVLIEAMAACRPVVAVRGGGVPEIVVQEETGLMVPVGDVEGIAAAVSGLLDHPEKARSMGAAGRKRAEELFSIEAHVRKVEALYEEILEEG